MIKSSTFKISALILSAISFGNVYSECLDGKIKYIERSKEVIKPESYCYDSDLNIFMSSKPCAQGKECQIMNLETIVVKTSEVAGVTGSLGFKICNKFHGTPQIIEYWAKGSWASTSRCLFSDGSFIDTASMAQKANYAE
jgi:hypothetical protein